MNLTPAQLATILTGGVPEVTALRLVYRTVNGWLGSVQVPKVNELLREAPVDDLSDDVLLALLTVTLRSHADLPDRPAFFRRAKTCLAARGLDVRDLLAGLG